MASAEIVLGCDDLLDLIVGFVCEPEILLTSLFVVNRKFHAAVHRCDTWSLPLRSPMQECLFWEHYFIIAARDIRAGTKVLPEDDPCLDERYKEYADHLEAHPMPNFPNVVRLEIQVPDALFADRLEWVPNVLPNLKHLSGTRLGSELGVKLPNLETLECSGSVK